MNTFANQARETLTTLLIEMFLPDREYLSEVTKKDEERIAEAVNEFVDQLLYAVSERYDVRSWNSHN